jgi:hypothetical protein
MAMASLVASSTSSCTIAAACGYPVRQRRLAYVCLLAVLVVFLNWQLVPRAHQAAHQHILTYGTLSDVDDALFIVARPVLLSVYGLVHGVSICCFFFPRGVGVVGRAQGS